MLGRIRWETTTLAERIEQGGPWDMRSDGGGLGHLSWARLSRSDACSAEQDWTDPATLRQEQEKVRTDYVVVDELCVSSLYHLSSVVAWASVIQKPPDPVLLLALVPDRVGDDSSAFWHPADGY